MQEMYSNFLIFTYFSPLSIKKVNYNNAIINDSRNCETTNCNLMSSKLMIFVYASSHNENTFIPVSSLLINLVNCSVLRKFYLSSIVSSISDSEILHTDSCIQVIFYRNYHLK